MLRRIRIGFGLLAAVLLAALGFLIVRTLDTLDRERELAHASVANRVFDEAEGAFADFLRDEQARPAEAYRGRPAGVPWMQTAPDFVLAYFEIDHRGRIRTSSGDPTIGAEIRSALAPARTVPTDPIAFGPRRSAAATTERSRRDDEEKEAVPTLSQVDPARKRALGYDVSPPAPAGLEKKQAAGKPEAPVPGTARNVQSIDLITGRAKAGTAEPESALPAEASPYSSSRTLETLGRIAKMTAREEAARETRDKDARKAPKRLDESMAFADRAEPADGASLEGDAFEDDADFGGEIEAQRPQPAAAGVEERFERVEPLPLAPSRLSSASDGDARLVLYRTALDDQGRAVRQGMVVGIEALGDWLTRRVLGESRLRDDLSLELHPATEAPSRTLPADRYVYAYRFAEPFESLSLELAIAPLDDGGNSRNIGWLSALLVAASTIGLFAVYRTASVAVHFAERRSNFAAAVSHELKTPLTAIRMYGEMLRDGMVPDEAKRHEYYTTITTESERLTRLINNVLEWSKLEKHQREAALVSGDVGPAIREVTQVVAPHAGAEGFEIEVRLPAALPAVRHDPDALQQILYNLIDNAIKYARGHEPARIEIEAVPVDDGLAIRVRDHGPGVAPDKLPLVFDAFYRSEDELTRQTKGTGIGLALARGLAESMNGRITARNHPEGGLELELLLAAA